MASQLVGKWKLESSENMVQYMQAIGECHTVLYIPYMHGLFNQGTFLRGGATFPKLR